jgi:hypothetical protein
MNNLSIFIVLVLCGLLVFKYTDFNKNDRIFLTQMFFFFALIFITKEKDIYGLLFLIFMIYFSQKTMEPQEAFTNLQYSELEPVNDSVNDSVKETIKCNNFCKKNPEKVTTNDNCLLSDLMRKPEKSNQIPIQIIEDKDVLPSSLPNPDLNFNSF